MRPLFFPKNKHIFYLQYILGVLVYSFYETNGHNLINLFETIRYKYTYPTIVIT